MYPTTSEQLCKHTAVAAVQYVNLNYEEALNNGDTSRISELFSPLEERYEVWFNNYNRVFPTINAKRPEISTLGDLNATKAQELVDYIREYCTKVIYEGQRVAGYLALPRP